MTGGLELLSEWSGGARLGYKPDLQLGLEPDLRPEHIPEPGAGVCGRTRRSERRCCNVATWQLGNKWPDSVELAAAAEAN